MALCAMDVVRPWVGDLVGAGFGGLDRLQAGFEFGGFVGTTELAKGLRFGGEITHEIGAVGAKLLLLKGDQARVAGL